MWYARASVTQAIPGTPGTPRGPARAALTTHHNHPGDRPGLLHWNAVPDKIDPGYIPAQLPRPQRAHRPAPRAGLPYPFSANMCVYPVFGRAIGHSISTFAATKDPPGRSLRVQNPFISTGNFISHISKAAASRFSQISSMNSYESFASRARMRTRRSNGHSRDRGMTMR